ncbi:DNA ligase [Nitriliruptoraceae bacterium ZYF776]|nr:DNA ligase [Profundirhabdus halotolerans]
MRPMLAVPGDRGEVGRGFRHEIKWDGARALAHLDGEGGWTLRSRTGVDVTARYPELADLAARVAAPTVLDGEVVAVGADGVASFGALQPRMHLTDPHRVARAARTAPVQLVVFDVLVDGGEVVLAEPLEQRRARLEALGLHGGAVQVPPDGDDLDRMLAVAEARGDEGVVSKRLGSPYRPGVRSRDWVKLPFARRTEVVVGAWRPEGGHGDRLGALLVGAHDADGRLVELGGVGSGLAGRAGTQVRALLTPSDTWPFTTPPRHRDARPVAPTLVGTVRYRGMTREGRLRQPVWLGLRDDVAPRDVRLPAG